MRKTIFINSHPIQYFAPLYKYLNEHGVPTACWYCSDENVRGHLDRQFGTQVEWDVPLLEGYEYLFFRNRSWKPSLYNGFFGLFNPGMILALFRERRSVVVVHGWAYFTHWLVLIAARIAGHTVCLRGENPLNQELLRSHLSRAARQLIFRFFLFPWVQRFLYIGSENKAFYIYYGVPERKLVFTPYAVDNGRFTKAADAMLPWKGELRKELGLPENSKVVLFAAKLIPKKNPMDLLKAFARLPIVGKCLVVVGDGVLRSEMEKFIEEEKPGDVVLAGFVNQLAIAKYYAAADLFVLCSGAGETWGLSVNEAMNFNLPVVVTDIAGCAADLVREGKTGFVASEGDVDDLSAKFASGLSLGGNAESAAWIERYSYDTVAQGLKALAE